MLIILSQRTVRASIMAVSVVSRSVGPPLSFRPEISEQLLEELPLHLVHICLMVPRGLILKILVIH